MSTEHRAQSIKQPVSLTQDERDTAFMNAAINNPVSLSMDYGSGLDYDKLMSIQNALESNGIVSLVTEGGITLKIADEKSYQTAKRVLEGFNLEMELGNTDIVMIKKSLR